MRIDVILSLLVATLEVVVSVSVNVEDGDHVTEGGSVQLYCVGEGDLEWVWHGERIVRNSSRFIVTHDGHLIITEVSRDLVGEDKPYICTNGTHNDSVIITLQYSDLNDKGSGGADVRTIVIGCVIGVAGATVFIMLVVLVILYSCYAKDKVSYMDHLEYTEEEELVLHLNFDKLSKLDPDMRANIDLPFLAHITNTDSATLSKYMHQWETDKLSKPEPVVGGGGVSKEGVDSPANGSIMSFPYSPSVPRRFGLNTHTTPPSTSNSGGRHSGGIGGLQRVHTVTDFNLSNSFNLPSGTRLADLRRSSTTNAEYSKCTSSQPVINRCMSGEEIKTSLLEILTLVQQTREGDDQNDGNTN